MEKEPAPVIEPTKEFNDSGVLFERLNNPRVKAQLISLYEDAYNARAQTGNPVTRALVDANTNEMARDAEGALMLETVSYIPPTREEIEKMINERLKEAQMVTNVDYLDTHVVPTNELMNLNWKIPQTGETPNIRQWSVVEGHEKGHNVRQFGHVDIADYIKNRFYKGFDLAQPMFDQSLYEDLYQKMIPGVSFEEAKQAFYSTIQEPAELAERMSQLKNYFGMKANEEFTKEHLDYARTHYVDDTRFDNLMTQFFQAITAEKEKEFLTLMNTVGI